MNRKTFLKGGFVGVVIAFSAIAVMGMVDPGMSPWVRLIQSWPGTQESGHINVDGNVGANGIVIQDNTPNDGYLEFPGEPMIHSRSELIGPKGDKGDKGDAGAPGGGGGIKAVHDIFSNETFQLATYGPTTQHIVVSPVFNVIEGDVLMVSLRKEATNITISPSQSTAVLFELVYEVETTPGGVWVSTAVLATTKFGMELENFYYALPRFSWTPHATYVVPSLAGVTGNVRLAIVGTVSGDTEYEEYAATELLPQTIRGEIVVM